MLKVAIIGCGKIADSHAAQISRIAGCELVAACDREELMAVQLCDRFQIAQHFTDVNALLATVRPDVVHITTPPQYHLQIGTRCLENGCHILVEKPFTLHSGQASKLIELANHKHRILTVGHDAQFSDGACQLRKLVKEGYLGGPPVHIESYWGYDFGDATYAKTLLADRHHWARRLPGGLIHNIISHGMAKIAEFLAGAKPRIIALGFISPFLQSLGENSLIDELRVIIHDENDTTAYFTFSSQMSPSLHQFRIFGPENGLLLDEDKRILIKLPGKSRKSYAEHFIPPFEFAGQYFANLRHNIKLFLKMDFHMDLGKKNLFSDFYNSIKNDAPPPIPYREILLTSVMMDSIFAQIDSAPASSGKIAGGEIAAVHAM